jgi:FkbM family methyltransferase
MIKRILQNALQSTESSPIYSERLTLFKTLCKLNFKTKFRESKKQPCFEQFFKYRAYGYSYLTLTYLFEEIFLRRDYAFKSKTQNPVIVDCGANIGIAMLYFKYCYPQAQLYCFEPNPNVFKLLNQNRDYNKLGDVTLYPVALSNFVGQIPFFMDDNAGTLLSSVDEKRGGSNVINCQAQKLSDYLKHFESVDLIKMDVEGSEWMIVDDLKESGSLIKIQQLIIEYHHKIEGESSRLAQFLKIFEDHGFEYNLRTNYASTGIFQDILIHFFK